MLSKFLRWSLLIFIIKGFQTIVFISLSSICFWQVFRATSSICTNLLMYVRAGRPAFARHGEGVSLILGHILENSGIFFPVIYGKYLYL